MGHHDRGAAFCIQSCYHVLQKREIALGLGWNPETESSEGVGLGSPVSPIGEAEGRIGNHPVSYTHLDVYKRQTWQGVTVDG